MEELGNAGVRELVGLGGPTTGFLGRKHANMTPNPVGR